MALTAPGNVVLDPCGQARPGNARDALALLVGYTASISVARLEAHVATDNHASRHVAEAADFTQANSLTDDGGTEFIRYTRDAFGGGAAPFTKQGPGFQIPVAANKTARPWLRGKGSISARCVVRQVRGRLGMAADSCQQPTVTELHTEVI